MSSPAMMCLPSGRTKNCSADGFSLPVLSPMKMITLLTPSTGVFRIACTCQTRLSSKPQLACRKALTVSLVGVAAVKLAGSGLGNTGAADGAGAAGAGADGTCADGACSGAAGTSCCATACKTGKDKAISATALAKRADRRIKRFLLKFLKS